MSKPKPEPHEVYITPDAHVGPLPAVDAEELQRVMMERSLLSNDEKARMSQDAWRPFARGEVRPVARTVEAD